MDQSTETNEAGSDDDIFGMPDEQVASMSAPPAKEPVTKTAEELAAEQAAADQAEADRVAAEEAAAAEAAKKEAGAEGVTPPGSAEGTETAEAKAAREQAEADAAAGKATPPVKEGEAAKVEGQTPAAEKKDPPATVEKTDADYTAIGKQILAPFQANGKQLQMQSAEEAIKLMQMGANYTKKMQALQPALRVVRMLENNKLLDESQLSYLIDLHQRKPEAIQKLLADSKFDPMSADADKAASYVPTNHGVSDTEIQFDAVLDEVQTTSTGQELINEVVQQWDKDSKQALFQNPRLLVEINNQKANGLYGRISEEVERRKVLGELQGVPFLKAYEMVGQDLHKRGLLQPQPTPPKQPEPVETRVATPAAKVINNDQARAASPTKVTPAAATQEVNFLDLSDDDFLKQMHGRV